MKVKELREKTENELKNLIRTDKERLKKFRFALANRQLKTTHEIGQTKTEIARAETILREKAAEK